MTAMIKNIETGKFEDRSIETLHDAVVAHYTKIGLYDHATPIKQQVYALGEAGELSVDGVLKGDLDEIKDGVGDVLICLINWAKLEGVDSVGVMTKYLPIRGVMDAEEICIRVHSEISDLADKYDLLDIFKLLDAMARLYGFTIAECLGHAYDTVIKRKVKPLNGTLVKESDWHKYPELEKVAAL